MASKGNRARVWFGESSEVDQEISQRFSADLIGYQGSIRGIGKDTSWLIGLSYCFGLIFTTYIPRFP